MSSNVSRRAFIQSAGADAVEAAEAGADVILLEKTSMLYGLDRVEGTRHMQRGRLSF